MRSISEMGCIEDSLPVLSNDTIDPALLSLDFGPEFDISNLGPPTTTDYVPQGTYTASNGHGCGTAEWLKSALTTAIAMSKNGKPFHIDTTDKERIFKQIEGTLDNMPQDLNFRSLYELAKGHGVSHETFVTDLPKIYAALAEDLKFSTERIRYLEQVNSRPSGSSQATLCLASEMQELKLGTEVAESLLKEIRAHCIIASQIDPSKGSGVSSLLPLETSDIEDTDSEDEAYCDIRCMLQAFQQSAEDWMMIEPILNSKHRRDIHIWARLSHYGCITLPCKSMFLHKDITQLPPQRRKKKKSPTLRTPSFSSLLPTMPGARPTDFLALPAYAPNIWEPRDDNQGYSSGSSYASGVSAHSRASSRSKKRRLAREFGAFVCTEPGCFEVFDRQCDLTHHERIHCNYEERPHACSMCDKRFLYPKDLRRHERVHQKRK
jgi:hypothetical protein